LGTIFIFTGHQRIQRQLISKITYDLPPVLRLRSAAVLIGITRTTLAICSPNMYSGYILAGMAPPNCTECRFGESSPELVTPALPERLVRRLC
jgi:hypothetical protein